MASNGSSPRGGGDTENSLEKIKRQLTSNSGRNLLQGPLLKRSETLRKWNERWMTLDPTTGKMEYKIRRTEVVAKGTIEFDSNSTITLSPVNFHGLPKYEGCCFYIGTPQKKEYYLCAETPGAARAWVSTLQATQLVLKAHKEAVNSLSGNGTAKLGTVAAVVAAANSMSLESSKEIEAAMKISLRTTLGTMTNRINETPMDDLAIMKETMRVKDEELQQLARDLRARDSTIKEIAEKLSDTAEAAEAAASAAHAMDEQRRMAFTEIARLTFELQKLQESSTIKLRAFEEKTIALSREKDELLKHRDSALREAQLWRSELGKARERVVILEGAVVRADERVKVAEADAETRVKEAMAKQLNALKEKEELLAYINALQAQLKRQESDTKQVLEEKTESCSDSIDSLPLTKHVDLSDENVDKACLSVSRSVTISRDDLDGDDQVDVREIVHDTAGNTNITLDIPVVNLPVDHHPQNEDSSFNQP